MRLESGRCRFAGVHMRIKLLAVAVLMAASLAGCTFDSMPGGQVFSNAYGARTDAGYKIPSIPLSKLPSKYRRQTVNFQTSEKPGTIIVDTANKHLYFVEGGGKAIRYGIGVGKEGFE